MNKYEEKIALNEIGFEVAKVLTNQYASVRFNIKNGEFMGYNLDTSHLPETANRKTIPERKTNE